jgi:dihydrofolate reductase
MEMIGLIAAVAKNNVIGGNNNIPWSCPNDLQFFKRITTGSNVIMGRKTFDSLGRPLPNRTNIVISRSEPDECPANVLYAYSLENALEIISLLSNYRDAWIIGGSQIYKEALTQELPDKILISRMNFEADGDVLFPEIPSSYHVTDIMNIDPEFSVYRYDRLHTQK